MPNGMSASKYFETNDRNQFVNETLNFSAVNLLPKDKDGKRPNFTRIREEFKAEHDRFFVLEQDQETQQWKPVSMVEKFGDIIFNTAAFSANSDLVDALYEIVEAGNLFFYNRGEAEPLQFTFRKANPDDRDVHVLPTSTTDLRLTEINAQRREQVKDEMRLYEAYQEAENKKKVLGEFKADLPDRMAAARQRTHNALSLANPGPLEFQGGNKVTLPAVTIKGSPRYAPAEIESIVLAACDSQRAAAKNGTYSSLNSEEMMVLGLSFGIHENVLVAGRKGTDEQMLPVFEEGRKYAAELIEQEMSGDVAPLKKVMMDSLRNHILACRECPSLDVQSLRMFEEIGKMANLISKWQLYDDKAEFDPLNAEAKAMAVVARAILAGAEAEKELQEAQQKGKFTDEKQRERIVSRIITARYFAARHYQSIHAQNEDPEIAGIQEQLDELSLKEVSGEISSADREVEYNKLLVQQTRAFKLPDNIREIMDEMKRGGSPEILLAEYATVTAEGQKLLAHTDPFKMIEAITKLPKLTASKDTAADLTKEMREMRASRMNISEAEKFWKSMQEAMGADQFDLKLMPDDFSRLVILQDDGMGNRSLVSLAETLNITIKDKNVSSMNDAGMMDRIRNQLEEGNVFFYHRGQNVPHRLSLNENGMAVTSDEPVRAKKPNPWARLMNLLFPGRYYRKEFALYAQESYLKSETATATRTAKAATEEKVYEDAKNTVVRGAKKKDLIDKGNILFRDMSELKERAHKILSLDDPQTVSFTAKEAYTGKPYSIPEGMKKLFAEDELDALCLASISSPAAAGKYMEVAGDKFGTTADTAAFTVNAHIYHDILSGGRDATDKFIPLIDAGREEAATALQEYTQDKPQRMAQLLVRAIRDIIIAGRTDEGVMSNATMASDMGMKMMNMLDRDEKLRANCGIDKETLDDYRRELKGLRMIGEAYENAGKAYKVLARAINEDRLLTEEESLKIATDLQTYRYLNTLQCSEQIKASAKDEVSLIATQLALNKICYDPETNRVLDPRNPKDMEQIGSGKARAEYFTPARARDKDYELKKMYDPLPAVVALSDDSLENIRNHVKEHKKVQDLSKFTDPMAFADYFNKSSGSNQDKVLHEDVSKSRSDAQKQINQNRLEEINNQLQQLNSMAAKGSEINPAPEPQIQSGPKVAQSNHSPAAIP